MNEKPLIENYKIVYSPSSSLLQFCNNKGSGKVATCVSFGFVKGQERYMFEQEAQEVAQLFNTTPILDATKSIILQNTKKDILHFASHGEFNITDPLSSGIKLYDDILSAREIVEMTLNSELVTLSACETGINESQEMN